MLAAAPSKPQSANLKKSLRSTFSLTNKNLIPQNSTTQQANRIKTKAFGLIFPGIMPLAIM